MSMDLEFKLIELRQQVADLERSMVYLRTAARNALADLENDDIDAVRDALKGIAGEK